MLSKIISLGDRIEITKQVSEAKRKELEAENSVFARTLVSKVYDIIDETQIKIAMPIVEGRVIPLPVNSRFNVCFFTAGGLYKSRIIIVERYKENGLYVLVAELVEDLKKYQRRQYYRLEFARDIEYLIVEEALVSTIMEDKDMMEDLYKQCTKKKGILVDLSGGGLRFASQEKLLRGDVLIIKLDISINSGKKIDKIFGKVLFSNKMINNGMMHEQRIEFFDLKDSDRETIIRYIFEQERKMRQSK